MNKIFKVLWDATSQQFVVTSELGKSKGKTKSVKTALVTAVGVATLATSAQAAMYATTVIDGVAGQSDAHAGAASIAIGSAFEYTNAQGETSTTRASAPLAIAIGLGATAAKSTTLPADSTNPTNSNFADPLAAVAIGASSVASGYTSVAYGYRARATDRAAVAVGPDARAAGYASTAIGNGSYAKDMSTTALGNYAYAEGFQAVAVGASRHAEGLKATGTQSILLGTSDNADLTQDQLMGPGYADGANPWSEYTGTDLGTAQPTVAESRSSIVSGKNALGIGVAVKSTGDQAIAQGYYANASSKDSIAIGTLTKTGVDAVDSVAVGPRSNITSTKSNAFGSVNTITGANSTAIGNNNVIASEKVMVLGNNVNVTTGFDSAVVLGDSSAVKAAVAVASYTYAGTTYNFAGTAPKSVVSVGAAGAERQIVNVAAGQISNTSTDAINGSQLYALGAAVETQIKAANENATKPLTFMGDTGSKFERKLGTQTNVVGGATANLTDNNIGVVADGNDTLTIKLAEKIDLGKTGSVTMGDTVINNQGLTITNGPSITNVGINAGNTTITNVSAGVNATDAVNVQQLNNAFNNITTANSWTITGNNNAENATVVGNQTVSFNNGTGTVAVVNGTNVAYNVDFGKLTANSSTGTASGVAEGDISSTKVASTQDVVNAINGSGWKTTNTDGTTSVINPGDTVNYVNGTNTVANVTTVDGTTTVSFDAKTTDLNVNENGTIDAPTAENGSSLVNATTLVKAVNNVSWNVNSTKVEGSVKSSVKGDTTASKVKAGDTVNVNAGNNIEITRNGNTVAVATSMTPTFTSVQVGGETGPVISSDNEGNVKIAKADGTSPAKITNVAAGTEDNDAVNVGQLKGVANNLNNKIDNVDQRASRGIAVAGAIGMLPQPHISGKSMVAAATTNYRGEQAVAVGYSRLSDNGKHIIKLSGSSNLAGKKDAIVGASYGYQW